MLRAKPLVTFRRKVEFETLALLVSQLLRKAHLAGCRGAVGQYSSVLKSGYEEGYVVRGNDRKLTRFSPVGKRVGLRRAQRVLRRFNDTKQVMQKNR